MRRLIIGAALLGVWALLSGCRYERKSKTRSAINDGEPVSLLNVADPRADFQLTRGFWGVENDSWRWTMKNFTVMLRPPANSAQNGATLELKFSIPDVIVNRLGPMTIDAYLSGHDLGPEKYPTTGEFTYRREIAAGLLGADPVAIDFSVDKGLPPNDHDSRELALIVTTVGLLPK